MKIKNDECVSEYYAVISYAHDDRAVVDAELSMYDRKSMCYWIDEEMQGGKSYREQFFNRLDDSNCKGIIFFITEAFLLSPNCIAEVDYFYKKYQFGNEKKFCFLVLPEHIQLDGSHDKSENANILNQVISEFVKKNPKKSTKNLAKHIDSFLDISQNGQSLHGVLGRKDYIEKYCSDGQTFEKAGILFGHKRISSLFYGYFPQKEKSKGYGATDIEKKKEERVLDKNFAYYAPVEWLVIKESDTSAVFLSKDLLWAIEYISLKYPLTFSYKTISEQIEKSFKEYFVEEEMYKIKKVRFLHEEELKHLIMKMRSKDEKKRNEILLPEPTYFAKYTEKRDAYNYWLAGDMEDARRVDTGLEGLSAEPVGVEMYYVRVVIEVEKMGGE